MYFEFLCIDTSMCNSAPQTNSKYVVPNANNLRTRRVEQRATWAQPILGVQFYLF